MDRWQDSIEDEDLRTNPTLDRYKSPEEAYKGLVEARQFASNAIKILPPEATPEMIKEWDDRLKEKVPGLVRIPSKDDPEDAKRFWNSLGVPEDEDGYTVPDDFDGLDEAVITDLKKVAAGAELTTQQHHKVLEIFKEANAEIAQAQAEAAEQATEELKKTWGGAYEDNISITNTLAEKFGADADHIANMSNTERLMLANIAKSVSSDPQVFNQINTPPKGRTPEEIQSRISDIRGLLLDRSVYGDQRKKLLKEQNKLYTELDRYA